MAQGDTIQAKVGDLVEASFKLDYKKAAVKQLPNRDRYAKVGFTMRCEAAGKTHLGDPPSIRVTEDDQQMTAVFSFSPAEFMGPDAFMAGETWTLMAFYHSENEVHEQDAILLGHVKLVAP